MKSIAICCLIQSAPYHNSRGQEALDFILAASAFSTNLSVIFFNEGIFQLYAGQQPATIGYKRYTAGFAALAEFDVHQIYAEEASLIQYKVFPEYLFLRPALLSTEQIQQHLHKQDHIFLF